MKVQCGCKGHEISSDDTNVVIYKGETFKPMCALREAIKITFQAQSELKIAKLEIKKLTNCKDKLHTISKKIRNTVCFMCDKHVGKGWQFYGDGIICQACQNELGGHG